MQKPYTVLRLLTLAGVTPFLAAPVFAQDSYTYFGLGAGKARTSLDSQRIADQQAAPNYQITGLGQDDNDQAYKAFLGYQFNRYVGLELGYFNLGSFSFQGNTAPPGTLNGRFQIQGGSLDVVGTLPITENFSALGRIGGQVARTRATFSGSVPVAAQSVGQRELNVKLGVGLQYAFSPSFMIRAEAERFRINDAVGNKPTTNLYSVSFVVPFGRSAAPAPRMAEAAPAYVAETPAPAMAPMPAPAPVVAMAPAAPVLKSVTYSADTMFRFDQATLQPEGKQALDGFAQDVQGLQYGRITVNGYADRLGSEAYNQKLSLERAEAVKAYLVDSGKLDAGRIDTVGMSESQPVTTPDECKGTVETPKLVRCLRPDRRVEISVTGAK